jgi:hypothetical protein
VCVKWLSNQRRERERQARRADEQTRLSSLHLGGSDILSNGWIEYPF